MKKQAILITGLASLLLVVAGCSSNPMAERPTVQQQDTAAMVIPVKIQAETNTGQAQCPSCPQPAPVQPQPMVQQPSPVQAQPQPMVQQAAPMKPVAPKQPELIKITGIGYGAESTYEAYTQGQRRLMAIRSSKLDAYRSLAEQLYGIKIDSNTSVSTLTAKNDSFRARVNAIVRGARVVSITPMADKNYETVLEVYVDKVFFTNAFVYSGSTSGPMVMDPAELCGQGVSCHSIGSR